MKLLNTKDSEFGLFLLTEILSKVPDYEKRKWYLEDVEAIANIESLNTNMIELRDECLKGKYGKEVDFTFLKQLISKIENIDSLMILSGNINESKLDFKNYKSIYKNVEFVFEYFDSTEWNFSSSNIDFIDLIQDFLEKRKIDYTVIF